MDLTFVLPGECFFKMEVASSDTLRDIKQKLESRKGFPAASISLSHNGRVLAREDATAAHNGVQPGSFVYVFVAGDEQRRDQEGK